VAKGPPVCACSVLFVTDIPPIRNLWSIISIAANIAEGFKKRSKADKLRFYNIAQGSIEESRYYLILIRDLEYGDVSELTNLIEEVSKLFGIPIHEYNLLDSDFLLLIVTFGETDIVMKNVKTSTEEFEKASEIHKRAKYVLRLYVTGMTPKSTRAIDNVRKLCHQYLEGAYELKVIDIYQQPKLAAGEQIIATPTLIKQLPLPFRKLIGDMSDTEKFLLGIDLKQKTADRGRKTE